MSMFWAVAAAFILLAELLQVHAHGLVSGIIVDGTYYEGYSPYVQYRPVKDQPIVIGWSIPTDLDKGYIAPDAYGNPDIICHKGATPAPISATVRAGGTIVLEWSPWPESHHGPVIDYLANCNGSCETVDKTKLKFFKIDEEGLFDWTTMPGNWASDKLIANNNSWTVKIPSDIAPGNYVLRHEIIALHNANDFDGAQNYPQCINLKITGSGTANPPGILGTSLYGENDPGVFVNIYVQLTTYIIPGPKLYTGGAGAGSPAAPAPPAATPVAGSSSAAAVNIPMSSPAAYSYPPAMTASAAGQQSSKPAVTVMASGTMVTMVSAAPVVTVTKYVDCYGKPI